MAKFGTTLPDYRGIFLRGVGGKSAALGVKQEDAGRLVSGEIAAEVIGTSNLSYHSTWNLASTRRELAANPNAGGFNDFNKGIGANHVWLDSTFEWGDEHTTSGIDAEFRPINKAVKYVIRIK